MLSIFNKLYIRVQHQGNVRWFLLKTRVHVGPKTITNRSVRGPSPPPLLSRTWLDGDYATNTEAFTGRHSCSPCPHNLLRFPCLILPQPLLTQLATLYHTHTNPIEFPTCLIHLSLGKHVELALMATRKATSSWWLLRSIYRRCRRQFSYTGT